MRLQFVVAAVVSAAICLGQAQPHQRRTPRTPKPPEPGAVSGSAPVPSGKVRIVAPGAVTIRGGSGTTLDYTLNGADGSFSVQSHSTDDGTVLVIQARDPLPDTGVLNVSAPKSLSELVVVTRAGALEAYDIDGSIQLQTGGGRIQVDRIGMNAIIRTAGGPIRVGTVRGSLRSFSGGGLIRADRVGGEAWLETAGGDVYISDAGGPVHAGTAGNIQIGRARSSVSARADGGLIEVNRADGPVTAQTSGGGIQVGRSKGVQCESAAGAIRLTAASGPMRAYTAFGSIFAEMIGGARLEDSTLNAAHGDVTVFIPSNVAVSVKAVNQGVATARIVSDFPEVRVLEDASGRGRMYAEGLLNGGGPVLRISAAGTIYLRRPK